MYTSIFNQLFKIKYGNRSEGTENVYDVEKNVPGWDKNFDILLTDLSIRKKLFEKVYSMYGHSQNLTIPVQKNLGDIIPIFEEINKLRFSEPLESIIAQEVLMLVYGIKILTNLLPLVKTEGDAVEFYKLYCILQETCLAVGESYKNDKRNFWHRYSFKLGLHWLTLTLVVKEVGEEFFTVDKSYGLYFKNHHGRGTNPLYFILPSIANLGGVDQNDFIKDFLRKEIRNIIESGIKK